jgi:predicted permease
MPEAVNVNNSLNSSFFAMIVFENFGSSGIPVVGSNFDQANLS